MKNKIEVRHSAVGRRDTLRGILGLGLWLPLAGRVESNEAIMNAPPQENDVLVFAFGEREGEIVAPEDVSEAAPQILAYPVDPATGVIRNGTRLNQVMLIRLDSERMSERTRSRSAANVVAYSAVCTHTGCDVTEWDGETRRFQCPCHDSQFDPADDARVVGGPAPRQLPSLPLKLANGLLAVAGGFDAPIGFQQPGIDPFGF